MKNIFCLALVLMMLTPAVLLAGETIASDAVIEETQTELDFQSPLSRPGETAEADATIVGADAAVVVSPEMLARPPRPDKRKSGKKPFLCPKMGRPSMVAAQDGGVIVLAGNKLQKFDSNLNLVKEAEIEIPKGKGTECPLRGAGSKKAVPMGEVDVVEELDFQAV